MSRSIKEIQVNSAAAEAIDLYSASALERDTVGCFFALQEIQFPPRKVQTPLVDRRVSGQPAQSASENAYKLSVLEDRIQIPKLVVPQTYLKIRLTNW